LRARQRLRAAGGKLNSAGVLLDKKHALAARGKSRQNLEVTTGAQAAAAHSGAARYLLSASGERRSSRDLGNQSNAHDP
jgi:hypothetical protein